MLDKSGFSFELLFHSFSPEEVEKLLASDSESGISQSEAEGRLEQFGQNKLKEVKQKSSLLILLEQFQNPISYLLIAASLISIFFHDISDAIAIACVIFINVVIGFLIELQARKSMDSLRQLEISVARVIRNASMKEINSDDLTLGDLIYVKAGDMIPADGRLMKANLLQTNESALTGESLPVDKTADSLEDKTPLAERVNMLYKGTSVLKGNGYMLVTGIGLNTELGKITTLTREAQSTSTPLDKKLEKLSKTLILVTGVVAAIFIVAGLLRGDKIYTIIETAIALAVAAIPEGLPIVSTIALAYGMLRLAKRNAIIKKLSSVETLGGTNVIFTDKTGTLTENVMEVNTIAFPDRVFEVKADFDSEKISFLNEEIPDNDPSYNELILIAALCNNASLDRSSGKGIGDPIEIALLKLVALGVYDLNEIKQNYQRLREEPFSSDTKIMGVLSRSSKGNVVTSKGATEAILMKCSFYRFNDEIRPVDSAFIEEMNKKAEKISSLGMRVLAFAIRHNAEDVKEFLNQLIFVGFIGFLDPPRHDIGYAVDSCKAAGIKIVMVTGDHPKTGFTIAQKIGIVNPEEKEDLLMTGAQLQELDMIGKDKDKVMDIKVFARVTPAQKLNLVAMYQNEGNIVAMTGDGINDTPALKKADIGVAMGTRGTQVAKDTADVVLKDDSFVSIVEAIFQGRVIFQNIREFIIFLLSCNLSEIFIVVACGFIDPRIVLLPIQILFLNLITDVFPALALGVGRGDRSIMLQPPRNPDTPVVDREDWKSLILYCLIISACIIVGVLIFEKYYYKEPVIIQDMIFFSLAFAQLWHVFNMSSGNTSFWYNEITKNKFVWLAIILCTFLLVGASLVQPMQKVLNIEELSLVVWISILGISLFPVLLIQILKRVFKVIN